LQLAPIPDNEFIRSQSLRALNILDTTADIRFDLITHFASHSFNAPITSITLIDTNRQWFKSIYGLNISELPRNIAICSHAIYEVTSNIPEKRIFEVNNTVADFRFNNHPQVLEAPKVRSYIGYVIQSISGDNIGTFCIVDNKPRIFSQQEKQLLISLGEMAQDLINNYPSYRLTHSDCATFKQTDI
jgi:GAF domain-containing protein